MWKIIRNSGEMYEISNNGDIRNTKTGHILKQFKGKDGYMRTQLGGKIGKTVLVHRLVAKTFIPNPKNKPEVNHIDGNKSNNNVKNLEWATRNENQRHAYNTGLKNKPQGTRNPRNKLSEEEVEYIRKFYKPRDKKYGAKALGEKFNVSPKTICAVYYKQNWNE